jgi:hypothetical protein
MCAGGARADRQRPWAIACCQPAEIGHENSDRLSSGMGDIPPREFAPTAIVGAVQWLGERIDLIGVETSRKRQDLTTEFIEPGRLLGQPDRSRLDPGRLSVHPHHLVTHRVRTPKTALSRGVDQFSGRAESLSAGAPRAPLLATGFQPGEVAGEADSRPGWSSADCRRFRSPCCRYRAARPPYPRRCSS